MSSTPTKAVRKSPAERESEIRAAAVALALAEGLDGVTLRRIATRVGVTPPLVAHYHPAMDVLVAETFATIVRAEIDEVREAIGGGRSAVSALSALLDYLLSDARDDVTVIWLDGWSRGRRNPGLAVAVRQQMDAWQQLTRRVIASGQASGEFAVSDAGRVAWRLLGIVDGLNAHSLVHSGDRATVRSEVAALTEAELGLPDGALTASTPFQRHSTDTVEEGKDGG